MLSKIKIKHYVILMLLPPLLSSAIFFNNYKYIAGIWIGFLGTIVNHAMMLHVASKLKEVVIKGGKRTSLVLNISLKTVILFGFLSLSSLFMGNRVIIPVLNYVVSIFILYFSLKKSEEKESD